MRTLYFLAGVPLVAFAVSVGTGESARSSLANPFVNAIQVGCGHCHSCYEPGYGNGHDFHAESPFPLGGSDHACLGNLTCQAVHLECGASDATATADALVEDMRVTQEVMMGMRNAALGEIDATVRLVSQFEAKVRINRERRLLQLVAPCSERYIIAQVALTPAQLEAIGHSKEERANTRRSKS